VHEPVHRVVRPDAEETRGADIDHALDPRRDRDPTEVTR
jgi:hypothetical protein